MKKHVILVAALLAAFSPVLSAQTASVAPAPAAQLPSFYVNAAAPTTAKLSERFKTLHQSFLDRGKAGPIGVLFLGDSITEFWSKAPEVWKKYYGDYQPADFGISGDSTQGVLWRIANGELDGIHPKVLVFMLGTNNTVSHTAAQIFEADKEIIHEIRSKLPDTKILLLAIFPRGLYKERDVGLDPDVARMRQAIITVVNKHLATLDDGKMIRFLDIGTRIDTRNLR